MAHLDEEPDYLVGTQPNPRYLSFKSVVMEAFLHEHGCSTQMKIAEVIGHDKSLVTDNFKRPHAMGDRAVGNYLDHIPNPRYRRAIVKAWIRARFDIDLDHFVLGKLTGTSIDEKTLERIDLHKRSGRIRRAAAMAMEAYEKTEDRELQEMLLDQACLSYRRLGQPGKAMGVARLIVERARNRGDLQREATGHYSRAQILRSMVDSSPEEVEQVINLMAHLMLKVGQTSKEQRRYNLVDDFLVWTLRISADLTFAERGARRLDRRALNERLALLTASLKQRKLKGERFLLNLLAARTCLLLGEAFRAREFADVAYNQKREKGHYMAELCGQVEGQILQATESVESARDYLLLVSRSCETTEDYGVEYLIEYDLARLESRLIPSFGDAR